MYFAKLASLAFDKLAFGKLALDKLVFDKLVFDKLVFDKLAKLTKLVKLGAVKLACKCSVLRFFHFHRFL